MTDIEPTEFVATREQADDLRSAWQRAIDKHQTRAGFRLLLCQCWRALTLGSEPIATIYDAPLTVWLIAGTWARIGRKR